MTDQTDPVAQWIEDLAVEVSGFSPCQSKRGVVIVRDGNVIAHGYNYKPLGFECDGSDRCKATCRVEAVHAEEAALLQSGCAAAGADLVHVKSVNGRLVPSGGPSCAECSKLALAMGVAGVWLFHEHGWRRYPMAEFHALSVEAALRVRPVEPSPPHVDYITLLTRARGIVTGSVLYRRFIDGTPLKNDLAVWMADFALATVKAVAKELREATSAAASQEPPSLDPMLVTIAEEFEKSERECRETRAQISKRIGAGLEFKGDTALSAHYATLIAYYETRARSVRLALQARPSPQEKP